MQIFAVFRRIRTPAGAILFTKSPKRRIRTSPLSSEGGGTGGGASASAQTSYSSCRLFCEKSALVHSVAPPFPFGSLRGAEWVPNCPALNHVFPPFLRNQKWGRRRLTPLVKASRFAQRADAKTAPYSITPYSFSSATRSWASFTAPAGELSFFRIPAA